MKIKTQGKAGGLVNVPHDVHRSPQIESEPESGLGPDEVIGDAVVQTPCGEYIYQQCSIDTMRGLMNCSSQYGYGPTIGMPGCVSPSGVDGDAPSTVWCGCCGFGSDGAGWVADGLGAVATLIDAGWAYATDGQGDTGEFGDEARADAESNGSSIPWSKVSDFLP